MRQGRASNGLRFLVNLLALSLSKPGNTPRFRYAGQAFPGPVPANPAIPDARRNGTHGRLGNAGTGEHLEVETALESSSPEPPKGWRSRLPSWATVCEASVFLVFAVFFLAYGLTPLLGGDGLGLVGADEPRYAQIAHEMLVRFDSASTLA